MDFTNEHYVRLYTRDTLTWKRLGWHGQNVLMQVLRKMDLSGVLEVEGIEPWEVVTVHCAAPEADARAGMARCLELGCLVHVGPHLVAPKYREANEAVKSDRQRQLESRGRRRAFALDTSPNVTPGHAASRNVTPPSRHVTNGHVAGPNVTPGHVRSRRVTPTGSGSDSDTGSDTGSGSDSEEKILPGAVGAKLAASARARGSAQDPAAAGFSQTSDPDPDPDPDAQLVAALVAVWGRVSGAPTETDHGHIREALGDVQRAAERYRERPSACFERAAQAFVADCGERGKRPVLRWLCTQVAEWALPAAAEQLSEDEKLAEARRRAAARESAEFIERCEAEQSRALRGREEAATAAPSPPPAPAPSTSQNYTPPMHRALPPAHRALRQARKALADAKLGRASESELGELQQRVQHCVRAALAESSAARASDAPEPGEERE